MAKSDEQSSRGGWRRRDVLGLMLGAGLGLSGGAWGSGPSSRTLIQRTVPRSGEKIPVVGLGTSGNFEVGTGAQARAPVKAVLERFAALGGRVVDTSPMYGSAETVLGDLAAELGITDDLWLATKVWTRGREAGIAQMNESFARLGTDRMDLMQVHNLVDAGVHLPVLRDWKDRGRIRYVGVTHFRVDAYEAVEKLVREESLDFVQFNYSVATRDAERRLLSVCAEHETAVIINRAFEDGRLFARVREKPLPDWAAEFDCESWAQYFLKYVLSHPAVTCVIPATSKVKHLVDNMGAGTGRLPDAGQRARMAAYFDRL